MIDRKYWKMLRLGTKVAPATQFGWGNAHTIMLSEHEIDMWRWPPYSLSKSQYIIALRDMQEDNE